MSRTRSGVPPSARRRRAPNRDALQSVRPRRSSRHAARLRAAATCAGSSFRKSWGVRIVSRRGVAGLAVMALAIHSRKGGCRSTVTPEICSACLNGPDYLPSECEGTTLRNEPRLRGMGRVAAWCGYRDGHVLSQIQSCQLHVPHRPRNSTTGRISANPAVCAASTSAWVSVSSSLWTTRPQLSQIRKMQSWRQPGWTVGDIGVRALDPPRQVGAYEQVEDPVDAVGRDPFAAPRRHRFGEIVSRRRPVLCGERGRIHPCAFRSTARRHRVSTPRASLTSRVPECS